MDITTQFNDCLSGAGARPISPFVFQISALNEFLQEAYRINSHITELTAYLRSIRASYLTLQPHRPAAHRAKQSALQDSTTLPKADKTQPLTDAQRTRIDAETRQLLTTISAAIRQLSDTAQISSDLDASLAQRKRDKLGLGVLGRWAAGGGATAKSPEEIEEKEKADTVKRHREGVLWFLQRRLERAGEMQRGMVEVRVKREVERSRSILYKARGPATMGLVDGIGVSGGSGFGAGEDWRRGSSSLSGIELDREEQEAQRKAMEAMLSPEQLQMFEREQQDMLRHYNDELNKIKTAESSLLEISSLQTDLAQNLEIQSENISQLVEDSFLSTENVQRGNKELKKASERKSTAQMVFWASCGLSLFLVTWDLIF